MIVGLAAIAGSALMATYASDTNSTDTVTSNATAEVDTGFPIECWTGDAAGFEGQMRGPPPRMHGGFMKGGFGGGAPIEVSSEFQATVTAIANNDTDVQSLLDEGYNVTSVMPNIKNVVSADGTVVTKATSAVLILQKDTTGYATVNIDVTNAKVTQIVIMTRTVIDKTGT